MIARVSILVVSLLLGVVAEPGEDVSRAIERYLDVMQGIQMAESNSEQLYIQRALNGLKVASGLLDRYGAGEYQDALADPTSDKSKKILMEVGLNGILLNKADNKDMKLAVDLFVAANQNGTCKQAVQDLKEIFRNENGKIRKLIDKLASKCPQ